MELVNMICEQSCRALARALGRQDRMAVDANERKRAARACANGVGMNCASVSPRLNRDASVFSGCLRIA
jgi:hypothetical protein